MTKTSGASRVGRPRKHKSEKIEYQHIAVHSKDYLTFMQKADDAGLKKVEAFHEMVTRYRPKAGKRRKPQSK